MKFTITALAIAMLSINVAALGINCRGNTNCIGTFASIGELQIQIYLTADEASFPPGAQIACAGDKGLPSGICAFTQNTGTAITGAYAKTLISQIIDHGCKKCGSVPFDLSGANNVQNGELTVNWVSKMTAPPINIFA